MGLSTSKKEGASPNAHVTATSRNVGSPIPTEPNASIAPNQGTTDQGSRDFSMSTTTPNNPSAGSAEEFMDCLEVPEEEDVAEAPETPTTLNGEDGEPCEIAKDQTRYPETPHDDQSTASTELKPWYIRYQCPRQGSGRTNTAVKWKGNGWSTRQEYRDWIKRNAELLRAKRIEEGNAAPPPLYQ